jgi:PAS domain-containing protein
MTPVAAELISLDEWQDVLSDLGTSPSKIVSPSADDVAERGSQKAASQLFVASVPKASPRQSEPMTEVVHLRRLIETQPACLLRVGIDGLLLAANEASLRLLGAGELSHILGSNVTERMIPEHHEEWLRFAARAEEGASGSFECELADLSGVRRTVLLQGVPLLDHPDGVPSMIVAIRDNSGYRRLETALQEAEVSRQLEELRNQLEQALLERQRLATALDEREADRQRLVAEHTTERARCEQTAAEEQQLALLLKEREGRQLRDDLQARLDAALVERQRAAQALEEREGENQRVIAEQAAERARLEQTLAEEHQLALLMKEREARQLRDDLQARLDAAIAERQQAAQALEQREGEQQRVIAEQAAERARLEQALAEEHQLALLTKEREGRQLLDDLQAQLIEARAEREQLAQARDQQDVEYQRQMAAYAAERAQAEEALAAAILKQERSKKAVADHCVELQALDETARNLELLAATGRMAIEVGRELQAIVASVDTRARHLLTECSLDADYRQVVEALRGDAVTVASLARQLAQVNVGGPRS